MSNLNFLSLSAKPDTEEETGSDDKKSNLFLKSFVPVSLSPSENEEYSAYFFPGKEKKDKSGKTVDDIGRPKQGELFEMISEINAIATNINMLYAILRSTINASVRSVYKSDIYPTVDFSDRYVQIPFNDIPADALVKYLHKQSQALYTTHTGLSDTKRLDYLEFLSKGATFEESDTRKRHAKFHMPFIIKPSGKYKGGYDIVWIGNSGHSFGSSPLMGAVQHAPNEASESHIMSKWVTEENLKKYHNGIGQDAYDLILQLNDILTNGAANSTEFVGKRKLKLFDLSFNFEQFNRLVYKTTGIPVLHGNVFKNLSPKYHKYEKFLSIFCLFHPNIGVVNRIREEKILGKAFDPSVIVQEYYKTTPNISFSIALHLPEHLVHYITQTPINEKPPLTTLSQWVSLWSGDCFKKANTKGRTGKPVRYVLKHSEIAKLTDRRKEAGLYIENGTTDANNIFVSNRGTLMYCPKSEVLSQTLANSVDYEKASEDLLQAFFDRGFTPKFNANDIEDLISVETDQPTEDLYNKVDAIEKKAGTLLAATWDYGKAIYAGKEPHKNNVFNINGVVPDSLIISSYLEHNFEDGLNYVVGNTSNEPDTDEDIDQDVESTSSSVMQSCNQHFSTIYNHLFSKGKVPSFQELVNAARDHFGIKTTADEKVAPYEKAIYHKVFDENLIENKDAKYDEAEKVLVALEAALENSGRYGTLSRYISDQNPGSDRQIIEAELKENERFFNRYSSKLAQFKNVYNWIGGYIYYLALDAVKKADFKDIFGVNDLKNYPSSSLLMNKVMPFAVVMTTYVPNSESIMRKANILKERNTENPDIDIKDILVPGTKPDAQMFPHQVKAHKYLRNRPRFAVLDIQAGGGKTITVLSDIACTSREIAAEKGEKIKALVICPDNLIRNWCEDVKKISGSNWNMVPVNTHIVRRWKQDKLDNIIRNAPINTIVVVGMDFLSKALGYNIIIGGRKETASLALEFIKNYGFNYVAIDEAHRVKNINSKTHKVLKQLCNSSVVSYVRLASGTIIPNKPSDIVGLSSMLSGNIFRSEKEFEAEVIGTSKNMSESDKFRLSYKMVKQKLKDNAALITVKRKEWAFLLPSPIEWFGSVYLSYEEEEKYHKEGDPDPVRAPNEDEDAITKIHRKLYEAVLNESAEELAKEIQKVKDEKGIDDEDDLDEEIEAGLGEYYFQRLDRIVMDPMSDPAGKELFEKDLAGIDLSKFVPRKIQLILSRINLHFQKNPWKRGEYRNFDFVDYTLPDGTEKSYVALRQESEDGYFSSSITPDRDTKNWKEEKRGKIIILAQYTASIAAIYDKLPEQYKKVAVTIFADNARKENDANLQAFMKNPDVQIIICQAARITEGFNLQMASRLIRAEAPWTPGAIEQSNARLFRPLPGAARREVVYLDWIITNATLEVVKVAKLYAKTLENCKYEEVDNKDGKNGTNLYRSIIDRPSPPKMSLNKFLLGRNPDSNKAEYPLFQGIKKDYLVPYADYCDIRNADFDNMRKGGGLQSLIKLVTIDVPQNPKNPELTYKHIEYIPYVPRQDIRDPHNFQYVNFVDFMSDHNNAKFKKEAIEALGGRRDLRSLVKKTTDKKGRTIYTRPTKWITVRDIPSFRNLKVHFEGGYGVVDQIRLQFDSQAPDNSPVIELLVRSSNGVVNTVDASSCYVIQNLDSHNEKIFKNSKPVLADEKQIETKVTVVDADEEEGEDVDLTDVEDEGEDVNPEDFEETPKPKTKEPKAPKPVVVQKPKVYLNPVVYNEFVGLEVQADDENDNSAISEVLKGLGITFEYKSQYAILGIRDKATMKAVLDFVKSKNYKFSKFSLQAIKSIASTFVNENTTFAAEVVPFGEFKTFHAVNHKQANKGELRMYPMVSNGKLKMVIDLKTNPSFAKFVGKLIPGITTQKGKMFKHEEGMHLALVRDKNQLKQVISRVLKSQAFEVVNKETLGAAFTALRVHTAKED